MSSPTFLAGSVLLGSVFNWGLLGALSIQVYIYVLAFPKDSKYMKTLVGWVFLLDLIHTAFATHFAWYFLVEGKTDRIGGIAVPPLSSLISISVQMFFVWRIWKLAALHKIIHFAVMGLIAVTAILSLIGAWWASVMENLSPSLIPQISSTNVPLTLWVAAGVICDTMITTTIVIQLLRRRSGNIFSYKTNQIVHRAIRMTIETGAVTAAVLIATWAKGGNSAVSGVEFLLGFPVSKLYSNSLLASLNARAPVFQMGFNDVMTSGTSFWNADSPSTNIQTADQSHIQLGDLNGGDSALFGYKNGITVTKSSRTENRSPC
ncbi:hypothetical protein Ac2012v2_003531 [Leucoagaricus gongylophorus]